MTRHVLIRSLAMIALPGLAACATAPRPAPEPPAPAAAPVAAADPHSFANPAQVRVRHVSLDLTVDFERRSLGGTATLDLARTLGAGRLVLDTRQMEIESVTAGGETVPFRLGEEQGVFGRPLEIDLPPDVDRVTIAYRTLPEAAALQWLTPEQTAAGEHPFLFTQSQAILARTWVPIQDTPSVRFTYDATVRVPPGLLALMSAENPQTTSPDGVYRFSMPQAIPSYLLALAAGGLEFRPLGPTTGVYAEPPVVEKAAWEFADTPKMVEAVEALYGPYRWGRYDLLVLPPSFPFGGMENPRLTFLTPTVIAGDRSLVALIAHELAHSWSGNLATNATWNDFWLNEGFTTYLERRIMEALEGERYREMLAELGLQDLRDDFADLPDEEERLKLDLAGRDPDDAATDVAYEKGQLFLRTLEEAVGRERFDPFLRRWFDEHAFGSVTTEEFLAELDRGLLQPAGLTPEQLLVDEWVHGPGLPANAPEIDSAELDRVEAAVARWQAGAPAAELDTEGWTTHHWLHFLRNLPGPIDADRMAALDEAFGFSGSGNSEIVFAWLKQAITNDYRPAWPQVKEFLTGVGRRKFLKPLYEALVTTDEGRRFAGEIYAEARPTYHPVAVATLDPIVGVPPGE